MMQKRQQQQLDPPSHTQVSLWQESLQGYCTLISFSRSSSASSVCVCVLHPARRLAFDLHASREGRLRHAIS